MSKPTSSSSSAANNTGAIGIDEAAKHSAGLESTAEAVMHCKTLLVDLDRRQNQIREGIRTLRAQQEAQHREQHAQQQQNRVLLETPSDVRRRIAALVGIPGLEHDEEEAMLMRNGGASPSSSTTTLPSHQIPQTFVKPQPMWLLCSGGVFVRTNQGKAYDKLLKSQHETHQQIEETRHELKTLVAELARLEGVDSALARANEGFGLAPNDNGKRKDL